MVASILTEEPIATFTVSFSETLTPETDNCNPDVLTGSTSSFDKKNSY